MLRSSWADTPIANGDTVAFVSLPRGGGEGGSNPLRIVLMLAVIVLSALTAGTVGGILLPFLSLAKATAVAGGLLVFAGTTLVNLVLPPDTKGNRGGVPSPTYDVNARGNTARLFEPRPVVYGRIRMVPDFAEPPYSEYEGGVAELTNTRAEEFTVDQWLYMVLSLGEGIHEIEDVLIGETSIKHYEDAEWELYLPGKKIKLVPAAVYTAPEVQDIQLFGPNQNEHPGQIEPADQDTHHTASAGIADDGNGQGHLVDSARSFDSSLIGKQVYIGGEQETGLNYRDGNPLKAPDYDDAANAEQIDKLMHPRRLRTIVDVPDATTLIVRPPFDSTYGPHNAAQRDYHIRNDYVGPFAVCPPGKKVNKIVVDVAGTPIEHHTGKGKWRRIGAGLRFEYREVDDSGNPVAGAAGDWQPLGDEWDDWVTTTRRTNTGTILTTVHTGWIKGRDKRRVRARRSTIALWGPTPEGVPLRISLPYRVPEGRYEVRGRRPTHYWDDDPQTNEIVWRALRGYIVEDDRRFEEISTLALRVRASSQLNRQTMRQVSVVTKRHIRTWGDAADDDLPNKPVRTEAGSTRVEITHTGHLLAVGQPITISGITGTIGGVPASDINGAHTIEEVVDHNTYAIEVVTTANDSKKGGGNAGHVDAVGGFWSEPVFTANPAHALMDAATADYGGNQDDGYVDLQGLRKLANTWEERGDEFNGVFDEAGTDTLQALNTIARAGRARITTPAGVVCVTRDEPQTVSRGTFTPLNTRKDSFSIDFAFKDHKAPDALRVRFFNRETWRHDTVLCQPDEEVTPERIETREILGITDREHAWREGMYELASDLYRRVIPTIGTTFEGFLPSFLDRVTINHPLPQWGQALELIAYDPLIAAISVDDDLAWEPGPNVVENSLFESDASGWSSGAAITLSSASARRAEAARAA